MLHHLQGSAQDSLTEVGVGLEEAATEAVQPATEPGGGGHESTLILLVGDNFGELDLNVLRVLGLATDAGEGMGGLGDVALLDEVTRRIGKEEQATAEDEGPGELDGDGNAIGTGVVPVLGAVDDDRGKQQTDGDAELVACYQGTTNLAGALPREEEQLVGLAKLNGWGETEKGPNETYNLRHV